MQYGSDVHKQALGVSMCLLDYGVEMEVVNVEFFDEENLLIVYRNEGEGVRRTISSVTHKF